MPRLDGGDAVSEPVHTLVADPPWAFGDALPGGGRGAYNHYALLKLHEIMRFPLPELADDCRLFLWVPASLMNKGLTVVEAWGFHYTTEGIWAKTREDGRQGTLAGVLATPKARLGMGRTFRMVHEPYLVGYRGRPERLNNSVASVLFAPSNGQHSHKPDAFYEMVQRLSPVPYAELFARRERSGWDCYGDEIGRPMPLDVL